METSSPIGDHLSSSVLRSRRKLRRPLHLRLEEPRTMTAPANPDSKRRWLILVLIALAQLMVVLDATVVNIALPSAQKALGFSNDFRQWIVIAYALSFGSLLLLGGRLGDMFGRKRVFIIGLAGFATASAVGGLAPG